MKPRSPLALFVLLATLFLAPTVLALKAHAQTAAPAPKQQYVYVLKLVPRLLDEANWTEADERVVGEHFERLKALLAEGRLILAGRTLNTDASQFGLVVLEVESEDEARALMTSDPTVRDGLMTAELFPYRVALLRTAAP